MIWIIIALALVSPFVYNFLFPLKKPNLENYFTAGQMFESSGEGVTQVIQKQEGSKVYTGIVLKAKAAGPPEHMHVNFDESGKITQGVLTLAIDGVEKQYFAGERIFIPKGKMHYFRNDTNEETALICENEQDFMPAEMVYSLSQLYPIMARSNKVSLPMLMKMAVLDDLFDVVPKGLTAAKVKTMKKVLKPYARVLGYSPYDLKSKPTKTHI